MPTRIWTPGDAITAARLNALETSVDATGSARPLFVAYVNSAVTLTSGTTTPVTWDVNGLDTDGGHSTSVNAERYTFATAGWWLCTYRLSFGATSSAGIRQMSLAYNGSAVRATEVTQLTASTVYPADLVGSAYVHATAVGDYLQVQALQTSGGSLNVLGSGQPAGAQWTLTWMHS